MPSALRPPPQQSYGHQNLIFVLAGLLRTVGYRFRPVHRAMARRCGGGGGGFGAVLCGRESILSRAHQNRGPPARTPAHLPALGCELPHVGRWVCEGKAKRQSLPGDWPAQLVSSWRQLTATTWKQKQQSLFVLSPPSLGSLRHPGGSAAAASTTQRRRFQWLTPLKRGNGG